MDLWSQRVGVDLEDRGDISCLRKSIGNCNRKQRDEQFHKTCKVPRCPSTIGSNGPCVMAAAVPGRESVIVFSVLG